MPPAEVWRVGFSGGLDSSVLLHALVMLGRQQTLPRVQAVHVHHGLNPRADAWAAHCARQCAILGVPFELLHVDARKRAGDSPEASAREARYTALSAGMKPGVGLLTAHHRRDQAETLLLQMLRGAGPAGLSAMPLSQDFGAGWLGRPLLNQDPEALRAYALDQGLDWIEDDSNLDPGYARNFLRHDIMPGLRQRWPSLDATLARVAALQAEAQSLLLERAHEDALQARGRRPDTLSVAALRNLSAPRQRNLLRAWLAGLGLPLPNQVRLESAVQQLLGSAQDAQPRVCWPGAELRRHGDDLHAMKPLPDIDRNLCWRWDGRSPLHLPELDQYLLPEVLRDFHGLDPDRLGRVFTVQLRRGGEHCRLRGHERVLKKLLQQADIPPWERERLPLLYLEDELAVVWKCWTCEPRQGTWAAAR